MTYFKKSIDLSVLALLKESDKLARKDNEFQIGESHIAAAVKALFNENMDRALNSVISVGNVKYKIIGVLASKGAAMGMSQDRRILIPLLKAKTLYGHSQKNYDIAVALTSVEKMNDAISTAIGTFRSIRKLKLSQDIEKHSFELQCTVDADRRLTQIEGTFTKIEKPKKGILIFVHTLAIQIGLLM